MTPWRSWSSVRGDCASRICGSHASGRLCGAAWAASCARPCALRMFTMARALLRLRALEVAVVRKVHGRPCVYGLETAKRTTRATNIMSSSESCLSYS